jgi:glycosyltransferase involved in cell wall biosynthesis
MRVLVVNNMSPFVHGGAEELAAHLVLRLRQHGHAGELLRVPFRHHPADGIVEQMLACRMMRTPGPDRVVALKFPAYMIPHSNKVLWLLHQYRQAYDLWATGHSNIPNTPDGDALRACIRAADDECFRSAKAIYVNSEVTQQRLRAHNGFESEVLHPPLNDPEIFLSEPGDAGDYLFCGGRINLMKRQHLLVEAMRHVRAPAKLVVAGPPDAPADARRLEKLVEVHGLRDRVRLELGRLPRVRIGELVRGSLACAYMPVDEDSYGYCTMEAFEAGRAVLTTHDAGGVLGLVKTSATGWVTVPEPQSLALEIDRLFGDRTRTRDLGRAAHECLRSKGLTWERTIASLTG